MRRQQSILKPDLNQELNTKVELTMIRYKDLIYIDVEDSKSLFRISCYLDTIKLTNVNEIGYGMS